jgi:DNA-nicking Smr family endonuclease
MKKPKGPNDRGHGRLSEDDHEIWKGTAASLEPLKRAKGRVLHKPITGGDGEAGVASRVSRMHAEPVKSTPHGHAVKRGESVLERVPVKAPPPLADFCKRKEKKISRGREEIEARIDLHGMRQAEAHAALRSFLAKSYERGLRTVLVITGKGAPSRSRDDDHGFMGRSESGVLRRNVPMWLAEPQLRQIVVSYTSAAIQHGGEGALYIHLRRHGRGPSHG